MFVIEDDLHSEGQGEFASIEEALDEVQGLARIPWDRPPNTPPCGNPQCGRDYNVVEYDAAETPRRLVRSVDICRIRSSGVTWREPRFAPSN